MVTYLRLFQLALTKRNEANSEGREFAQNHHHE